MWSRGIFFLTCLALLLSASLPSFGEEIWVKNRPFTGRVQQLGDQTLVELYPFAKAAGIKLKVQGQNLRFGQFTIPIQSGPGGASMVSLQDLAGVAGLKIQRNPRLGTLDVHAPSVGTGNRGDWSQVGKRSSRAEKGTLLRKFDCETYIVRVPAGLKMHLEPKSLITKGKPNPEALAARANSDLEFIMADKIKPNSGHVALSIVYRPTEEFDKKFIETSLQEAGETIRKNGGVVKSKGQIVNFSGRKFHKMKGTVVVSKKQARFESYFHFSKKHKSVFFLQVVSPESEAKKFFPRLRRALQKFRVK